jgi:hypothetical protein
VARGQARWCRGASLAPKDSIGTSLTKRGSPRQPTDGEEDGSGEAVISGANERLPEQNLRSVSNRGRRGSSWYHQLARRRSKHDGRQ